jgi:hypothetical protein
LKEKKFIFIFHQRIKNKMSSTSAIKQIADAAASPVRAASPKIEINMSKILPDLKEQLCSRVLWTYLILGLVLLAVVFYFFAVSKADYVTRVGTRPSGVPGFVDNPWFIYFAISIVGVLFVYGMYRGYVAATTEASRNMLNIVFAIIAVLIILWFYQFYYNGKLNANIDANGYGYGNRLPFFIAVSLLALLVLQFFLLWRTGDRLAAYTVIPLLVVIALFTWASWELSLGQAETF